MPKHTADLLRTLVSFAALFIGLMAAPALLAQEEAPELDAAVEPVTPALPGEPVTLDELLEYAQSHAPELLLARQRLDLGEAARRGAAVWLEENPELEAGIDSDLGDSAAISRWEIGLWQRFEIAGQQGLRRELAARYAEALDAELAAVAWEVRQEVRRLYRTALVYEQAVELQQETLAFTERLSHVARLRFEAGEEAKLSMLLAEAEQARARQRLIEDRATYAATLRELAIASGWKSPEPPRPVGELGELDGSVGLDTDTADEALIERAVANDRQIARMRAQLEQARARLELEQQEVWLDPAIGAGYEREETGGIIEHKLVFGLSLPLPLWNQNDEAVATAEAEARIAEHRIVVRTGQLQNRVRRAAELLRAAAAQVEVYEAQVLPALAEQLDLLLRGFELGEMGLLDVMTARDRLLSARRDALKALRAYHEALSILESLVGAPS